MITINVTNGQLVPFESGNMGAGAFRADLITWAKLAGAALITVK